MAELELQVPEMVFNPSLVEGAPDGFLNLFESLLDDVYKMSSLVPRVAKHAQYTTYQVRCKCLFFKHKQ